MITILPALEPASQISGPNTTMGGFAATGAIDIQLDEPFVVIWDLAGQRKAARRASKGE